MTGAEPVENRFLGINSGHVVQGRDISGGVHFHDAVVRPGIADKKKLLAALRALTAPVVVDGEPRTAFCVAPGRSATYGTGVLVVDGPGTEPPSLYGAVEPEDELWALGYPGGGEPSAEIAGLRCLAVLDPARTQPYPLQSCWGDTGFGSTGGPVLNWRTGAVCGLLLVTAEGAWLVPAAAIQETAPAGRAWLELLDDEQLRAGGQRYPGTVLRDYLADVRQLGEGHPYRPMVRQGPSLTEFYLPQELHHETDGTQRVTVDALADRHEGARILGDPGVGKSSLVRHLAAESAGRWLREGTGTFVPVLVSARALSASGSLPRLLAGGVVREIATVVDEPTLAALFEREPMPGTPWLVLVDGLDEVLDEFDRRLVLDRVLSQRGRDTYRFLVTSRPLGRTGFTRSADRFPTYVVEPFDDDELARFATAWFLDAGHRDPAPLVAGFMNEVARSGLGRLARVPLVSMMLCIVFVSDRAAGLPGSQYAVYERFFAVLARKLETAGAREEFRRRAANYGPDGEAAVARLLTGLPVLLERIAVARQGVRRGEYPDTRPILTQAVSGSRPDRPDVVPVETWAELVEEALRASGLLVHRNTEFLFLHQTIEEYLAARHLAARAGRADRRTLLAPQAAWPWPHLEVKIFIVALWTARGVDLTAQYLRLLARRHRELNVGFLVELGRRGVPLPARVAERVRAVLAARIHSGRTLSHDWVEAVRWLRDLDPGEAMAELGRLARGVKGTRAVEAVRELIEISGERGAELTRALVDDVERAPEERFRLAVQLLAIDRDAGIETLAALAGQQEMAGMAVEVVLRLAAEDPARGHELLVRLTESPWSGKASFGAARALLSRSPVEGLAVLNRVWRDLHNTPAELLALTGEIARISTDEAVWRFAELARTARADADVRYAAVVALRELNPEDGAAAMTALVRARDLTPATRVRLAKLIAEHEPARVAELFGHGTSPGEENWWLQHTEKLIRDDPGRAIATLSETVRSKWKFVGERLNAAARLITLDMGNRVLPALESITFDQTKPDQSRLDAADLVAAVDVAGGRALHDALAMDRRLSTRQRLAAANQIREHDTARALFLYLRICASGRDSVPARIEAGGRAGEIDPAKGVTALADLIRAGSVSHYADEITTAAVMVSRRLAVLEWQTLRDSYADDALRRLNLAGDG